MSLTCGELTCGELACGELALLAVLLVTAPTIQVVTPFQPKPSPSESTHSSAEVVIEKLAELSETELPPELALETKQVVTPFQPNPSPSESIQAGEDTPDSGSGVSVAVVILQVAIPFQPKPSPSESMQTPACGMTCGVVGGLS